MGKRTYSVVIATYNGEMFVEEQIQSILNQTIKPDEIIISDAHSSDETIQICKKLADNNKEIKWIILQDEQQLCVSKNFEKGWSYATSDYVFFADQDDVWLPNKIEKFDECISKYNCGLVFSNATLVDQNLAPIGGTLWDFVGYNNSHNIVYHKGDLKLSNIVLNHNIITGMSICIKNDLKKLILPFSEKGLHDLWIALLAPCYCDTISLNQECVLYRQHNSNQVGAKKNLKYSYKKRYSYFERVKNRRDFYIEAKKRLTSNSELYILLQNAIDYYDNRIAFMGGKMGILKLLGQYKSYKIFDDNPIKTFLKDVYYRSFVKKK